MKKIIAVTLAILTGAILAFPVLTMKKNNPKSSIISLYVLQTGVYKSLENAKIEQERIKDSVIYKDGDYYRVLIGASTNEIGLNKIEQYLQEENIKYYKKELEIFSNSSDLFSKYNVILEKAENKETVLLMKQKILENMVSL